MGNPIAHSLSPLIHALFARETRQNLVYTAILVAKDGFPQALDEFQRAGGKGLNITLPFKHEAWKRMDQRTPRAEQAGAVNTVLFRADGTRLGDNTDGAGLVRDIIENHGGRIADRRILLLGAGGAVRGVLESIIAQRPAQIVVANRTRDNAVLLAAAFRAAGRAAGPVEGCGYPELRGKQFDLVINGTSASLSGDVPPLPAAVLAPGAWCYDMAYGREPTAFVRWGETHGAAKSVDGLGMLVEQAAESFFLWRGVYPDTAPVIETLQQTLAR
jgi:shikimate dehydrogenase